MGEKAHGLRVIAFTALAWAACAVAPPVFAAHPIPGPVLYRVRPGSVVSACGSIAFHCEVWHLRGRLQVFHEHHDHDSVIEPMILGSDLELVTAGGHVMPFPHPGDLPLTALEGRSDGISLVFESPPASQQTAELVLTPFSNRPLSADGLVLDGVYDEGCCDRFRIDLGNVVLRPDRGRTELELHDGRFRVTATWRAPAGRGGVGEPVALDPASGYFWFFRPENPEVIVKILDACAIGGRYWIFAGGLTNLEVDLEFLDARSEITIPVTNPAGQKFATFVDTVGFACSPPLPGR